MVQERFRQVGNWGFELKNIQLLSDLREKLAKSFTVQVPLQVVNSEFVQFMKNLIDGTRVEGQDANCQLKFKIVDVQEGFNIEMPAKTIKINLTNEFLDGIEQFEGVNYRLN